MLFFSFLRGQLKKKKILEYYSKIAPRNKGLSLNLSLHFCPLTSALLGNAFGDGPPLVACCNLSNLAGIEIRFNEHTFDCEQYPDCQHFQSTLVQTRRFAKASWERYIHRHTEGKANAPPPVNTDIHSPSF